MKDPTLNGPKDDATLFSELGSHSKNEVSKVLMSLKDISTKVSQGDVVPSTSQNHTFLGHYEKEIVEYLLQMESILITLWLNIQIECK